MTGQQTTGHQTIGHKMTGHQMAGHQITGQQMTGHQMTGLQMTGHQMNGHQMAGNHGTIHQTSVQCNRRGSSSSGGCGVGPPPGCSLCGFRSLNYGMKYNVEEAPAPENYPDSLEVEVEFLDNYH